MTLPSGHANEVCHQSLLFHDLLVRGLQTRQETSACVAWSPQLLIGKLVRGNLQH